MKKEKKICRHKYFVYCDTIKSIYWKLMIAGSICKKCGLLSPPRIMRYARNRAVVARPNKAPRWVSNGVLGGDGSIPSFEPTKIISNTGTQNPKVEKYF